jgi:hypothetical protein
MRKEYILQQGYSRFWSTVLAAVFLLSVGCSPKYNQALVKRDLSELGPIKVVRLETPGILKSSSAETGFLALATIAVPGGSALLLVGDAYGKARGAESQSLIPDFGAVVMEKFLSGVPKAEPTWPKLTAVSEPIKEQISEQSTVIEFDVKRLAYGSIDLTRGGVALEHGLDKGLIVDGFLSKTVVTMKARDGEVLWQKSYLYLSRDYGREKPLSELEANNYALLKEEMLFAAEQTAHDFLNHLNGKATN